MHGNNNDTGGGLCLVIIYKRFGCRIHFRRTHFNALLNDGLEVNVPFVVNAFKFVVVIPQCISITDMRIGILMITCVCVCSNILPPVVFL